MRVWILLALVAAAVAQPQETTTHKPSFMDTLKNIFGALGNSLTSYVHQLGDSLLHETLPNLAGELIADGVNTLIHPATAAPGKRNVASDIQILFRFKDVIEDAKKKATGLGMGVDNLVKNFINGKINKETIVTLIGKLKTDYQNILHGMSTGLLQEASNMVNAEKKRDLSGLLNGFSDLLTNLEQQGLALFGQVQQAVTTLVDPTNLATLLSGLSAGK